jgi:hypothetical protein
MGVEGDRVAVRILGVVGDIGLLDAVERGAGVLAAAERLLLLGEVDMSQNSTSTRMIRMTW